MTLSNCTGSNIATTCLSCGKGLGESALACDNCGAPVEPLRRAQWEKAKRLGFEEGMSAARRVAEERGKVVAFFVGGAVAFAIAIGMIVYGVHKESDPIIAGGLGIAGGILVMLIARGIELWV